WRCSGSCSRAGSRMRRSSGCSGRSSTPVSRCGLDRWATPLEGRTTRTILVRVGYSEEGEVSPVTLQVAAAQFAAGPDVEQNLSRIEALAAQAATDGSELVVFPEASMYSWYADAQEVADASVGHAHSF